MSTERRFRLRGNTVKAATPAEATSVRIPGHTINVNFTPIAGVSAETIADAMRREMANARRLASNAPLPDSIQLSYEDLCQTYGLPTREMVFQDSSMRWRGYNPERDYPDVMAMQRRLFTNQRAVGHLLDINHDNYRRFDVMSVEDIFLLLCALLAYCDQDTDNKRMLMHTWVRAHMQDQFYRAPDTEDTRVMLAATSSYARTATLGSLPRAFFQPFSPSR